MDGMPVTIRLLDPPLHEFLPHEGPALTSLCKQLAKVRCGAQNLLRSQSLSSQEVCSCFASHASNSSGIVQRAPQELNSSEQIVRTRLEALHEANPMMGLR
jgi:phosphoenolpyruvate synthase/pyruvate phosphate dikinase